MDRWVEESEQETPYDGEEDEGAGTRSYLVASMPAYGRSMRDDGRAEGTKEQKRGLERHLSSARRRVSKERETERMRKR